MRREMEQKEQSRNTPRAHAYTRAHAPGARESASDNPLPMPTSVLISKFPDHSTNTPCPEPDDRPRRNSIIETHCATPTPRSLAEAASGTRISSMIAAARRLLASDAPAPMCFAEPRAPHEATRAFLLSFSAGAKLGSGNATPPSKPPVGERVGASELGATHCLWSDA